MNVFVTGGTGLVGSHVIQLLRDCGHQVRALVRNVDGQEFVEALGATAVFGAVENRDAWSHAVGTDAIVHSAAIVVTRRDWPTYQSINIDGAKNAGVTASELGVQLVHVSSVAVYGRHLRSKATKIDEYTTFADLPATDYYARSKRRAEATINSLVQDGGLKAVSLRPCVIYGERDRTFLPHVVRILDRGFAPLIGTGSNSLSIVYAGNVADAVLAALEHPEVTGPINVTNDGDVTQREFYAAVGSALGKRVRLMRVPIPIAYMFAATRQSVRRGLAPNKYPGFGPAAVRFLTADNPYSSDRARQELDWKPTTPPSEAIARSVRWFAEAR
jgi:nucleoside-diphosphate-sugar epimerase